MTMYHRICGCVTLLLIGLSSSKDLQEADTDHYQSYEQAREVFQQYEAKYPSLAKMHSIGKTVQQRDLLVLQVYFCSTLVNIFILTSGVPWRCKPPGAGQAHDEVGGQHARQ